MKAKNLINLVVLVALIFIVISAMIFYTSNCVTLIEDGLGLVSVTPDGKWKSCEGISIYPRESDVYFYPTTVQMARYTMPVLTEDSILELISIKFEYQVENGLDFVQSIIKDIEIDKAFGCGRFHYKPQRKFELEDSFELYLQSASDSIARSHNLIFLATLEFEKELKTSFQTISPVKGIKVVSLKVSMSPEFNELLKKRDDVLQDIKKAEEALKRAEQEAEETRAKVKLK